MEEVVRVAMAAVVKSDPKLGIVVVLGMEERLDVDQLCWEYSLMLPLLSWTSMAYLAN